MNPNEVAELMALEAENDRRAETATAAGAAAFARLLKLAETERSGQARRVARLIAGLWNGQDFPLDPYELRALDVGLSDDVLACLDGLRWGRSDLHNLVQDGDARVRSILQTWNITPSE